MGFKEIGRKIQQARELKGLSQKQLARQVGCSQSALSNYEKGKRRLYLSQLELIAEALHMPIDNFMESKSPDDLSPASDFDDRENQRLKSIMDELSAEDRHNIMEYIAYIRWRRQKEENQ